MSCIIVAEIGENHNGSVDTAKKMIEIASQCEADMVKFQTFDARCVADDDVEKEWFERIQLSDKAHYELREHARENNIEFFSTPFNVERAEFLLNMGLNTIKIASCEIVNIPLLECVNARAKRVFLSTGMATMDEIETAVKTLDNVDLYLLHCVSEYPLPPEHVNLNVMNTLRERFQLPVGYSDHTLGIMAPIVAAAMGAEVIEKHFTLDKTMEGTDHILSADPEELKLIVEKVREVELLKGSPIKKPTEKELSIRDIMRGRYDRKKL